MADEQQLSDLSPGGFQIGDWEIRPLLNRIIRDDQNIVLEPKVMEVLVCLAKRRGETVTKEQFMAEVWSGTVVTDDVLSRCISELRKALDDDWRDPHVIETIRKTGYRLVAPVRPVDARDAAVHTDGVGPLSEMGSESGHAEVRKTVGPTTARQPIPPAQPQPRPRALLLTMMASLVAILIWMQLRTRTDPPPPVPIPFTSTPGLELDASISPDGRQVAFASDDDSGQDLDIYIAQEGAEIPLRLTDSPRDERHPVWSPDGLRLAFVSDTNGTQSVFVVPSIGGAPRRVADFENRTIYDLAWAPKGKLIGIAAQTSTYGSSAIYVISEDSLDVKQLTFPPENFAGDRTMAFSPDGANLAFVRAVTDDVQDVFVLPVRGGEPRQVSFDSTIVSGLDWGSDDEEIVFASTRNGAYGLWRISASGGSADWILTSTGVSRLEHLSISRTGSRLIYVEWTSDMNLWRLWRQDRTEQYRAHPLIFSTRWDSHPDISPDGTRIAYASDQSGDREIWVSDRTGENRVQLTLTDGVRNSIPRWSPDGSELAFVSSRRGRTEIRVVGESGGGTKSVTASPRPDAIPAWSRDGDHIYFSSEASGRPEIWRAPRDSGATVQVTFDGAVAAMESVDGSELYYVRPDTAGIWSVPLTDEVPSARLGELVVDTLDPEDMGNWCVQEDGIYHVRRHDGGPKLMFYSFKSTESTVVAPLRNLPKKAALAVSPDRTWIVVSQEDDPESDIMLVDPFE